MPFSEGLKIDGGKSGQVNFGFLFQGKVVHYEFINMR